MHDDDTMSDAEAFADFRSRVDDSQTLLRLFSQKLEHFRLRPDVDAAARLIEQNDFRLGRQHLADHDLLLVTPGKRTDCRFAAVRLDVHILDRLIDNLLFALARCEQTLGHFGDAGERQILADRHRLDETVALAIFRHQHKALLDTLCDGEAGNVLPFEENASAACLETTGNGFQKFRATGAHKTINADDFTCAHIERHAVDQREARATRVGNGQVLNRERHIAPVISGWRRAEIEVLADHVAHDPFQINFLTRRIGRHGSVAQHHRMIGDLQRFFQMMRNVDDGDTARRQVANDLEQDFHFRGAERRSRLIHDENARIDRKGAGDFNDLLLAETKFLDRRQRVDIFFQFLQKRARQAFFLGKINAGGGADFAPHEDVVAHVHVGREAQFLMDDRDAEVARFGGRIERHRFAIENDRARSRLDDARKHFHQRRFASAVFAEKRRDLTTANLEIHALQGMNATIGFGNVVCGKNDITVFAFDFRSGAHFTSSPTGVTSQFFGLTTLNTPTTVTVLPTRFSTSTPESTCFFISLFSAEPAF